MLYRKLSLIVVSTLVTSVMFAAIGAKDNIAKHKGLYPEVQYGYASHIGGAHVKYILGYKLDREVAIQAGWWRADTTTVNRLDYWDLTADGFLPVTKRLTLEGNVGMAYGVLRNEYKRFTPVLGLGLRANVTPGLALTAGAAYYFKASSIPQTWFFPVSILYVL